MKRFGFLPLFFITLSIALAIAVFVRIRSYQNEESSVARRTTSDVASAAPAGVVSDAPAPDAVATSAQQPRAADATPRREDFWLEEQTLPDVSAEVAAPRVDAAQPRPAVAPPSTPMPAPATVRPNASAPRSSDSKTPPKPSSSTSSAGAEAPSRDTTERDTPVEERDASSDSTPPQLQTIEFIPPQIADGEQTMLVIQAKDDLSGVRSISGTILAPSGAVQGFACQREGSSDRFLARVVVPKDAAEGTWVVNYISLLDNASNANALNAARAGMGSVASFQVVSSRPDSQGPTLEAVWLDRRAMQGGEKNTVFVRASDDKAGVNLISGIFQSPSRVARIGFVCRSGGDVVWTCEMTAPACADCGDWLLEQVQLQDKANNMTTVRAGQNEIVSAVRLSVTSDMCDSTPPALESIALDRHVVSNEEQSTINVTVQLSDDACGVLSVSGQATGPTGTAGTPPRLYFSFTANPESQTWSGKLVVPRLASKGQWKISFLQVLDRGQNLKVYTGSDPLLVSAAFVVE